MAGEPVTATAAAAAAAVTGRLSVWPGVRRMVAAARGYPALYGVGWVRRWRVERVVERVPVAVCAIRAFRVLCGGVGAVSALGAVRRVYGKEKVYGSIP